MKFTDNEIRDINKHLDAGKPDERIVIVETKGREDLDVPLKTQGLKQWCEDINRAQSEVSCDFVFVDEESFNRYSPKSFADLFANFGQYKEV